MDLTTLQAAIQSKIAQAKELAKPYLDGKAMPKDVADQITALLGETDVLKAQYQAFNSISDTEKWMAEGVGTKAAHLGWREAAPDEGSPEVDPLSWREIKTPSAFGGRELKIRFQVPLVVQAKGYPMAYEGYLRKGMDGLGPQDRKTIMEGSDPAGGFLVPEDYQTELIRKVAAMAVMRALCRTGSTSRDAMKWPKIVYTADDKYTSGARLTWTGEIPSSSTVHRATEPVFGVTAINIHTAMASLPFSNDMLEDSAFDVLGIGTELLGECFGLGEDDVFINGSGVMQPFGMVTRCSVGSELIPNSVSGSGTTLQADNLMDLFFDTPAQYRRNSRFVMNSATAKVARKLKDGGTTGRYLWDSMQSFNQGFLNSPVVQDTLLGVPVVYDEFMPNIAGNAFPILFGDFTGYLIADRVGMSIQRLSELYAETNITLLLARKRVGGDVINPWRMRAQKIST